MADLARELTDGSRWQWRGGAQAKIVGTVLRVCRVDADGLLHGTDQSGAPVVYDPAFAVPDVDDPATNGVLIALAMEACDAIEAAGYDDEANEIRRGLMVLPWRWGRYIAPKSLLKAWALLDRIERGDQIRPPVGRWVCDPDPTGDLGIGVCTCTDRDAPPTLSECHQVGLCMQRGCWRRIDWEEPRG